MAFVGCNRPFILSIVRVDDEAAYLVSSKLITANKQLVLRSGFCNADIMVAVCQSTWSGLGVGSN